MARLGQPGDNDKLHVDGTEPLQFEEDVEASIAKCIADARYARESRQARSARRQALDRERHATDRTIGLMFRNAWRNR